VEGEEIQRLHLYKDLHQQHSRVPAPLVTCQAAFLPPSFADFHCLKVITKKKKSHFSKVHNDWTRGSVDKLPQGKFLLDMLRLEQMIF